MKKRMLIMAAGAAAAMLFAAPATAGAASTTPGVVPPQAHPRGQTYGQWSAQWWQWAFQTPWHGPGGVSNPLTVTNGPVDCSYGQHGNVWFLGGTFISSESTGQVPANNADRSCTVPTGTMLFVPIVNSENDNLALVGSPSNTFTEQQLRELPAGQMNAVSGMTATIDGRSVKGLGNSRTTPYRVQSPRFQYSLPNAQQGGNLDQAVGANVPAGPIPAPGAVADGAFLMLEPLSVGTHHLHWTGGIPRGAFEPLPDGFTQDITYTITVVPKGRF
jgi:hypothetical protein